MYFANSQLEIFKFMFNLTHIILDLQIVEIPPL